MSDGMRDPKSNGGSPLIYDMPVIAPEPRSFRAAGSRRVNSSLLWGRLILSRWPGFFEFGGDELPVCLVDKLRARADLAFGIVRLPF